MRWFVLIGLTVSLLAPVMSRAAQAPSAGAKSPAAPKVEPRSGPEVDALKAKGLVQSGGAFVLGDEKRLLEDVAKLRQARKAADRETAQRKKAEDKVAANQKFIRDGTKEWKELEKRLPKIKDVNIHNRTVTRMNALAAKVKEGIASQKDLEQDANTVSSAQKTAFVDQLLALAPKVEAAAAKYKALAQDAEVKSAIAKLNPRRGAPAGAVQAKVALGPSPDFSRAIDEVATWRSQLDSEAIPLRDEGGVHSVEAIVNGEPLRMIVDTGASHVTLPFEAAKKLGLEPGENDPTVQMKLANGAVISGKLMTLKTVRVGRFTVNNVSCIVFEESLSDPLTLLGTSFLSHFVVKLSQQKDELHLTEVATENAGGSAAAGG